jgi:hypothetical protein
MLGVLTLVDLKRKLGSRRGCRASAACWLWSGRRRRCCSAPAGLGNRATVWRRRGKPREGEGGVGRLGIESGTAERVAALH